MSQNFGRRLFANIFKSHSVHQYHISDPFPSASASLWDFITLARGGQCVLRNASSYSKGLANANRRFFTSSAPQGARVNSASRRQLTRRFASGGFLVLGTTPHSATAATEPSAVVAAAAVKAASAPGSSGILGRSRQWKDTGRISRAIISARKQYLHTQPERCNCEKKLPLGGVKEESKVSSTKDNEQKDLPKPEAEQNQNKASSTTQHHRLHAPTKEQLLAAATGFWSRLKVHFKWFSIRSARPFTLDEIAALFSWVLIGHALWVIFATTTFVSILIFAINTVLAQETLARWVGNYLTKSSGLKVVFESAIVPRWGDGVITFKNVFVSRRPGLGSGNVSKGSSETAAAFAAQSHAGQAAAGTEGEEDDGNYTQFDLSIQQVNVTLSFAKWFNGEGLLRDVEMRGVRGVVDRTHVTWPKEELDPADFRHKHQTGDFELDSFKLDDLLVTVYQPDGFRPFPFSIFSCELPQLRRQWLFYDLLCATTMSGSYDNSLFTIHPRQTQGYSGISLNSTGMEEDGKPSPWKKQNRFRIDGLNIDHLNRGVSGPFGWIREGTVDLVADIMFPAENHESLAKVMADVYDRLEATVTANRFKRHDEDEARPIDASPNGPPQRSPSEDDKRFVITDLRVQLNNIRAQVPIFTRDLSYINNALIRPIVAYMNSRRTFIPVQCRIVKRIGDFDGSMTLWDCGLMDDMSAETYEAFARDVMDEQARRRRLKKVGIWSLQLATQAIFMGMAGFCA